VLALAHRSGDALGDPAPGSRRGRATIAVLMVAILAVALMLLQGLFDRGDRRRAVGIVAAMRPDPAGPTVAERLGALDAGEPPACAARIRSACFGVVIVECRVAADPQPYAFTVDLVRKRAFPANDATRARLGMPSGAGR